MANQRLESFTKDYPNLARWIMEHGTLEIGHDRMTGKYRERLCRTWLSFLAVLTWEVLPGNLLAYVSENSILGLNAWFSSKAGSIAFSSAQGFAFIALLGRSLT